MKHKTKNSLLKDLKESIPGYLLVLPTIATLIIFCISRSLMHSESAYINIKATGHLQNLSGLTIM